MRYRLLAASLISIGLLAFDQAFDLKASMERGKTVYETQCSACHMAEGEGLSGVFPPLAQSDYLADKNRLVKVILQGVRGPMKVNGVDYDSEMNSFALSDEQAADVLNYILNSWGNKTTPVRPSEIQPALKAKTKNYQPY
ncbi:MAG: cytochrome c [Cyclobacteriaceae bacterium]|nr:cytochrome c [Cyclobacteriaceae bacterium]